MSIINETATEELEEEESIFNISKAKISNNPHKGFTEQPNSHRYTKFPEEEDGWLELDDEQEVISAQSF